MNDEQSRKVGAVGWMVAVGLAAMPMALIANWPAGLCAGLGVAAIFVSWRGERGWRTTIGISAGVMAIFVGAFSALDHATDEHGQRVSLTPTVERIAGSGWMRGANSQISMVGDSSVARTAQRQVTVRMPSVTARGLMGMSLAHTRCELQLLVDGRAILSGRWSLNSGSSLNTWEALPRVASVRSHEDHHLSVEWYYLLNGAFGQAWVTPKKRIHIYPNGVVRIEDEPRER